MPATTTPCETPTRCRSRTISAAETISTISRLYGTAKISSAAPRAA